MNNWRVQKNNLNQGILIWRITYCSSEFKDVKQSSMLTQKLLALFQILTVIWQTCRRAEMTSAFDRLVTLYDPTRATGWGREGGDQSCQR